ncbi:hypothetical protein D3C81_837120 [compost metagenome]
MHNLICKSRCCLRYVLVLHLAKYECCGSFVFHNTDDLSVHLQFYTLGGGIQKLVQLRDGRILVNIRLVSLFIHRFDMIRIKLNVCIRIFKLVFCLLAVIQLRKLFFMTNRAYFLSVLIYTIVRYCIRLDILLSSPEQTSCSQQASRRGDYA